MATRNLQAVIFDFDYTLADSSQGAFECINFALAEMGLDLVSAEAACRTIGLSLSETFLTLADHHDVRRCDEFHRLFVQRAEEVMAKLTVLYESVPAMIEALRQRGLRLAIVSTKYRRRINEILEREELMHGFHVVIGGEDVTQHKPHPEGLLEAMSQTRMFACIRIVCRRQCRRRRTGKTSRCAAARRAFRRDPQDGF